MNLSAEKGHFYGSTEATGAGSDDQAFLPFCDSFFQLNSICSRRKVNSIFGTRAYLVQQLLRFPCCDLFPKLVQYSNSVKIVDIDVNVVEQLFESLERLIVTCLFTNWHVCLPAEKLSEATNVSNGSRGTFWAEWAGFLPGV